MDCSSLNKKNKCMKKWAMDGFCILIHTASKCRLYHREPLIQTQHNINSLTLIATPHSDPLCKYNMRVYITRNWHKKSTGHYYYYGIIPCCLFLCEAIRLLWFARPALWTFLWSRLIITCFSCPCPLERPGIDSNHTVSKDTSMKLTLYQTEEIGKYINPTKRA
jgi:hypothetical protein